MKRNGTVGAISSRLAALLCTMAFGFSPLFAAATQEAESSPESDEVIVWTYDSFVSEWGPGKQVAEAFKKATGLSVRFVSHGDGGALLSKAIAEGSKADADIILGIDQNLLPRALNADIVIAYKPTGAEKIASDLIVDRSFRLVPYDYGHFAIIYDSEKIAEPPKSLEDLTKKEYGKKLILMDPRTSTPGLGFFGMDEGFLWKRVERVLEKVIPVDPNGSRRLGYWLRIVHIRRSASGAFLHDQPGLPSRV